MNFFVLRFETCFGPSTQGAATKTHLKTRVCAISKKRGVGGAVGFETGPVPRTLYHTLFCTASPYPPLYPTQKRLNCNHRTPRAQTGNRRGRAGTRAGHHRKTWAQSISAAHTVAAPHRVSGHQGQPSHGNLHGVYLLEDRDASTLPTTTTP